MPMLANAEMSVYARKPITASFRSDRHVTRWIGSSGGISAAGPRGDQLAQGLEVQVPVVHRLARVVLERGRLQEREHRGETVVPEHISRRRHRMFRVGRERGGHEQLRLVRVGAPPRVRRCERHRDP